MSRHGCGQRSWRALLSGRGTGLGGNRAHYKIDWRILEVNTDFESGPQPLLSARHMNCSFFHVAQVRRGSPSECPSRNHCPDGYYD